MPVLAMQIISKEQHPTGNLLRIYRATCPEPLFDVVFIANEQNNYEVGDVAAVATVGTKVSNNGKLVEIKPIKLRGQDSFGMGLGKTNALLGTDLTALHQ